MKLKHQRKQPSHDPPQSESFNGTQDDSTDPDWKNSKITYEITTLILSSLVKPIGKSNTKLISQHTTRLQKIVGAKEEE